MNTLPGPYIAMLLYFVIWLGVIGFLFVLALRLVRGVERIANALERKP